VSAPVALPPMPPWAMVDEVTRRDPYLEDRARLAFPWARVEQDDAGAFHMILVPTGERVLLSTWRGSQDQTFAAARNELARLRAERIGSGRIDAVGGP